MANRRSDVEAHYARSLRFLMLTHAYHDKTKAETICTAPFDRLATLYDKNEANPVTVAVKVDQGEVLVDSYGRGSLQTGL